MSHCMHNLFCMSGARGRGRERGGGWGGGKRGHHKDGA